MDLWTILRCWCIVYVLAVTIHSRAGTVFVVEAAVSRQYHPHHRLGVTGVDNNSDNQAPINIRSGRIRKEPKQSLDRDIQDTAAADEDYEGCDQLPAEELGQMLGGAYNARYMSVRAPQQKYLDPNTKKRGADGEDLLFAVEETYVQEISDQPAWEVNLAMEEQLMDDSKRTRRSTRNDREQNEEQQEETTGQRDLRSTAGGGASSDKKRPWECDMRVKWTDLGKDYFPRFLRTVECTKTRCFYGKFTCQPRSFTVQLLRRRRGRCVKMGEAGAAGGGGGGRNSTATEQTQYKTGVDGLPVGLRELWVWEERAVNFCCDCASSSRKY